MRRREFILTLGGAAAAWPVRAHLQPSSKPVVGFVHIGTADAYTNNRLAAFRRGLQEAGFVEGQNITIEYRFAENKAERLADLVTDLVGRQVAVIFELGGGPITALAAKKATSTIPIVIAFGSDPVKLGLVESLNRPGANVTGVTFFTTELVSKRIGLLCEVLPQAKTIAYLRPGPQLSSIVTEQTTSEALTTAHGLGRDLLILRVDRPQDLDVAFSTLLKQHADALFIHPHPFFESIDVNGQLAALTLRNAVPAISQQRAFRKPEA